MQFNYFSGDGDFARRAELSDDLALVKQCAAAFDAVWERAIPHPEYQLRDRTLPCSRRLPAPSKARQILADRLRELRLDAGLTAKELAARAGWERTKVSKIEHATRPPSAEAIRVWCQVCGAEDQAPDLIASLRAAEGMWVEWRRMERTGLKRAQEARLPLYERTRQFRAYGCWVLPGPDPDRGLHPGGAACHPAAARAAR